MRGMVLLLLFLSQIIVAQYPPEVLGLLRDTISVDPDSLSVTSESETQLFVNDGDVSGHVFFENAIGTVSVPINALNSTTAVLSVMLPFLTAGSYDVIFVNPDGASDTLKDGVTYIYNLAPAMVSLPDTLVYEDSLWVYVLSGLDPEGDSIYWDFGWGGGYSSHANDDTLRLTFPNRDVGTHAMWLNVFDSHRALKTYNFRLHVINTPDPPMFTSLVPAIADTPVLRGDTVHFSLTAIDPDDTNSTLYYSWFLNGVLQAGSGPHLDLFIAPSLPKACSVKVVAFDGTQQTPHTWHLNVGYLASALTITSPPAVNLPMTGDSTLAWSFSDPAFDSATTWYKVQFSLSGTFDSVIAEADSLQKRSFHLNELVSIAELPPASYVFLRVKAYNARGDSTVFPASQVFFLYINYGSKMETVANQPLVMSLLPNYPNPFNPSTSIRYGLPGQSFVSLLIFDIQGRRVRVLENGMRSAGYHSMVWDGRDTEGQLCRNGLYFCRLRAGNLEKQIKMIRLK